MKKAICTFVIILLCAGIITYPWLVTAYRRQFPPTISYVLQRSYKIEVAGRSTNGQGFMHWLSINQNQIHFQEIKQYYGFHKYVSMTLQEAPSNLILMIDYHTPMYGTPLDVPPESIPVQYITQTGEIGRGKEWYYVPAELKQWLAADQAKVRT